MAATAKTLLEHHGELYWGARTATPGYQYGLALDVTPEGVAAQIVYVLSDLGDDDEELVTPELLLNCYTLDDLERSGIVLSDLMDGDSPEPVLGWYCAEQSFFAYEQADELRASNERLDGYLDCVLQILTITPEEVAAGMPAIDEISFFDLLDELEGISERIDAGQLHKPLPYAFKLVGDALLGWQSADEADYR